MKKIKGRVRIIKPKISYKGMISSRKLEEFDEQDATKTNT